MDSYLVGFAVIGIGMILAGFNLAATIINYRAPGHDLEPRAHLRLGASWPPRALLTLATPTLGGRRPVRRPRPHRRRPPSS